MVKNTKTTISVIVLVIVIALSYQAYQSYHYLTFINSVEPSGDDFTYALYNHDYLFGDPHFYVMKLNRGAHPEEIDYEIGYNEKTGQVDVRNWPGDVILENFEESYNYAADPKLELINGRHLVLKRGGYYFSLYDVAKGSAVFNECCPFKEWSAQSIHAERGPKPGKLPKNERTNYGIWVEKNIQNKIKEYIEANK
jgi:hypothetical protein